MVASLTPRSAWIVLASVQGIGGLLFARLVETFGDPAGVLAATLDGRVASWLRQQRRIEGRPPFGARTLANLRDDATRPDLIFAELAAHGVWTLTPLDADFPKRLLDLAQPPLLIHGLGEPDSLRRPRTVALVGTRRPTLAGRLLATQVAARLVECDAVVVSGLAFGIDGAAHAATLDRGGQTVAVVGAGLASTGPRGHRRLREDMVASGGAVISEDRPTARASMGTYPRRNRIIAALADATIVIEAPARSGARITAGHALDLGRPLFVAPGRVGDWSVAGSLALLRETPARPLIGLDELVEDLGYLPPAPAELAATRPPGGRAAAALTMLGASEQAVARRLARGPAALDALVLETGLSPAVVSSAVTLLLMRGWVQAAGPAYVAAGPLAG